jgi:hypothetical protein
VQNESTLHLYKLDAVGCRKELATIKRRKKKKKEKERKKDVS